MSAELVNISGLRVDGRRPGELRAVRCAMGVLPGRDGSALLAQGTRAGTRVLAAVTGPAARRGGDASDVAALDVEFCFAPFATPERRKRRHGDRRLLEMETALRQSFESILELRLYPRSVITLHVLVLQSDGGALAVAINAGILALLDAGIAMRDFVVACSVVQAQRSLLLDPSHAELTSGGAELTVALLPRSGKVTLATMDARLPLDRFEGMLAAATEGCRQIFELINAAALENAAEVLRRRQQPGEAGEAAGADAGAHAEGGGGGGGDAAEEDEEQD